jgi:hypothetical protein
VSSTAGTFTEVSGRWTVPTVTCTREDRIDAEWVGIDGITSQTVEQDGTLDWCFEGTATYFTWYVMAPAQPLTQVGTSLQPGDQITAAVSRSGTSYTLSLIDSTRSADSFSETATCAVVTCLDTSVEWITERPTFSVGVAPLADYTRWKLNDATETASGTPGTIGSYLPNYQFGMVDATDSYDLSTTSALYDGNRFNTTWQAPRCKVPPRS